MRLHFDHFDLVARHYERVFHPPAIEGLLALLQTEPGAWLLDVGGGTGRVAAPLAASGARVLVCDRSRAMLLQAQGKGLPVVQASVERLPFATGAVPRVVVIDAFHHFTGASGAATQRRAACELVRVLAVGGRLLVQEPNIQTWGAWLLGLVERLLLMGSRILAAEALRSLFESAGAHCETVCEEGIAVVVAVTKPAT